VNTHRQRRAEQFTGIAKQYADRAEHVAGYVPRLCRIFGFLDEFLHTRHFTHFFAFFDTVRDHHRATVDAVYKP